MPDNLRRQARQNVRRVASEVNERGNRDATFRVGQVETVDGQFASIAGVPNPVRVVRDTFIAVGDQCVWCPNDGAPFILASLEASKNRVESGTYDWDTDVSSGYGPSITFTHSFSAPPVVTATVENPTGSSVGGYYVKIIEVSSTAVRFRHYNTSGFWGDAATNSGVVHWIAAGE